MKTLLLSLAAVATVATAMPAAAAQSWTYGRVAYQHSIPSLNRTINQREANLLVRVDQARARRQITPAQAQRLRVELRRIEAVEQQYRRRGLNRAEYASLNTRLDRVQVQLERAAHSRRW